MHGPILQCLDVTRVFGVGATSTAALRGVSLDLFPGEFTAIMGASGSGKSTLLSIAGTLDLPTSGKVIVEGTDTSLLSTTELAELRRAAIGFVFQSINLLPTLSAAENVAMPLELGGMGARQARVEALEGLKRVGIADQADKYPDDMSGGQAQRVAIARAMAGNRRVILADEPTGALDSASGMEIVSLLRDLANEGCAVGMVTHDPRFAAYADRVVTLSDGLIEAPAS